MNGLAMKKMMLGLLLLSLSAIANAEIRLYTDSGEFAGCMECSKYSDESICNKYGTYGSRYNNESIWNKYGLGSKYDSDSPFNRYGSGLKMVTPSGSYLGQFSMSASGNYDARNLLRKLWEISDGDYSEMRDLLCD